MSLTLKADSIVALQFSNGDAAIITASPTGNVGITDGVSGYPDTLRGIATSGTTNLTLVSPDGRCRSTLTISNGPVNLSLPAASDLSQTAPDGLAIVGGGGGGS